MAYIGYLWVGVGLAVLVIGGYVSTRAPAAAVIFGPLALYITVEGLDLMKTNGEG